MHPFVKNHGDPVSLDELVYRRVLNRLDFYDPELPVPVVYVAFRPTDADHDGISVYRPACGATAVQVAFGNHYVAGLRVRDIVELDINGLRPTVVPSSEITEIPGHALIPQLNVTLRDGNKERYRLLARRLAELAGKNIVHRPSE